MLQRLLVLALAPAMALAQGNAPDRRFIHWSVDSRIGAAPSDSIQRNVPEVQPANNPGLMNHDQARVTELMTKYGPIDMIFFDGEPEGLKDLAWRLQPRTILTPGEIQTPEQYIPGIPLEGPREANLTMGTEAGQTYEVRAVVKHPLPAIYGKDARAAVR